MIMLLALPVIAVVALGHRYLVLYARSNVLIRRVRASRPTLNAVAATLAVAAGLIAAMKVISDAVAAAAPGWLNLVVLVLAWDAIKIGWLAILVAVRCARWGVAAVDGADLVESERHAAANSLEAGGRAEGQWQTSTRACEA
jgi:hypothetical protein